MSKIVNIAAKIGQELSEAVPRVDAWANLMTSLGTAKDKLKGMSVMIKGRNLNHKQLEQLYVHDDMSARIVDVVPDEMMRQGYRLVITEEEEEEEILPIKPSDPNAPEDEENGGESTSTMLSPEEGRVDVDQNTGKDGDTGADISSDVMSFAQSMQADIKLTDAMKWGRLFGAAALFVGADDGRDPSEPLNEESIRSIDFINVIEKPELTILDWYTDPYADKFGQPRTYLVAHSGPGGSTWSGLLDRTTTNLFGAVTKVHESRIILFEGQLTPSRRKADNHGFSWSVLERVHDVLQEFHTTWKSSAHLMTDMSQGVVSISGLMDMVRGGQSDVLFQRIELMNMARSVSRIMLLDADKEQFSRQATPLQGVADILDKAMLRIAGATQIPVSVLFGQDPAGLNSSGDIQIRRFYDFLRNQQVQELKPKLKRLYTLIMLAHDGPTKGVLPDKWDIEFNSLWQMTDEEKAELRLKTVQADTIEINSGVLLVDEVSLSRHTDDGFNPGKIDIDRKLRKTLLATEKEKVLNPPPPPPMLPGVNPNDPNASVPPPNPNAPPPDPNAPKAGEGQDKTAEGQGDPEEDQKEVPKP